QPDEEAGHAEPWVPAAHQQRVVAVLQEPPRLHRVRLDGRVSGGSERDDNLDLLGHQRVVLVEYAASASNSLRVYNRESAEQQQQQGSRWHGGREAKEKNGSLAHTARNIPVTKPVSSLCRPSQKARSEFDSADMAEASAPEDRETRNSGSRGGFRFFWKKKKSSSSDGETSQATPSEQDAEQQEQKPEVSANHSNAHRSQSQPPPPPPTASQTVQITFDDVELPDVCHGNADSDGGSVHSVCEEVVCVKVKDVESAWVRPPVSAPAKDAKPRLSLAKMASKDAPGPAADGQSSRQSDAGMSAEATAAVEAAIAAAANDAEAEAERQRIAEARFQRKSVDMRNVKATGGVKIEQTPQSDMWWNIVNKSLVGTGLFSRAVVCSLTTGGVFACNPADFAPAAEQVALLRQNFHNPGAFSAAGFAVGGILYKVEPEACTKELLSGVNLQHTEGLLIVKSRTALIAAGYTGGRGQAQETLGDLRDLMSDIMSITGQLSERTSRRYLAKRRDRSLQKTSESVQVALNRHDLEQEAGSPEHADAVEIVGETAVSTERIRDSSKQEPRAELRQALAMSGGQHAHRKVSFCNSAELICTDPAENLVLYESSVPVPETDERSGGRPPLPKDADLPAKGAEAATAEAAGKRNLHRPVIDACFGVAAGDAGAAAAAAVGAAATSRHISDPPGSAAAEATAAAAGSVEAAAAAATKAALVVVSGPRLTAGPVVRKAVAAISVIVAAPRLVGPAEPASAGAAVVLTRWHRVRLRESRLAVRAAEAFVESGFEFVPLVPAWPSTPANCAGRQPEIAAHFGAVASTSSEHFAAIGTQCLDPVAGGERQLHRLNRTEKVFSNGGSRAASRSSKSATFHSRSDGPASTCRRTRLGFEFGIDLVESSARKIIRQILEPLARLATEQPPCRQAVAHSISDRTPVTFSSKLLVTLSMSTESVRISSVWFTLEPALAAGNRISFRFSVAPANSPNEQQQNSSRRATRELLIIENFFRCIKAVPKPRSDPSLNHLHDSGVAVDQAGVAGGGRSGSAIIVGSRRLRKRRELDSSRNRRTAGSTDQKTRYRASTALLLGSSTSSLSSLTDCSESAKQRPGPPTAYELLRSCCLDFRWLLSISLACLAVCLCAGLLGLHASLAGRLTALTAKCVNAEHQASTSSVSGLTEDMHRLHSLLNAWRLNATAQAESIVRLRLSVLSLQRQVAQLYAARRQLAQVGPLRDKVRKLVQDSADRGAAIARLERSQRIMRSALTTNSGP
uniref:Ysc84 domain-containing protein n=1 Tax=Macrostomum lignano TaxID=282301 RepID=A0A1I8ITP5_9PLAT